MPSIRISQRLQIWKQNRKEKKEANKGKLNQTEVRPSAPEAMPPVRSQLQPNALVDPRMLQERQTEHSPVEKPMLMVIGESGQDTHPDGWAVEPDALPTYQQATGQSSALSQPADLAKQKKTLKKQIAQQQTAVNNSNASLRKLEKQFNKEIEAAKSSAKKAQTPSHKTPRTQAEIQTAKKKAEADETSLKALSNHLAFLEAKERKSSEVPVAVPSRPVAQTTSEKTIKALEETEKKVDLTDTPTSDDVEENEGAKEHHSRLGTLIKPFITVNKAQIQAAHDRRKSTRSEFETARKSCSSLRSQKADLDKKLKDAGKEKFFERSRQNAAAKSRQITTDLIKVTESLKKAEAALLLYQQQLDDAEQGLKEAEKNTGNLVKFATHFATSLRTMYRLSHSSKPEDRAKLDQQRTIRVPQLVIDTPDGRMQVDDLSLKLKALKFEKKGSEWAPVLGIEHMTGRVSLPLPDQQALKLNLELRNVEVELQAGFGSPLHSYVTSRFALTGATHALGQLVKNSKRLVPSLVNVNGEKVTAHLDDCSAKTFAALAHKGISTPGSGADKLFEALGFNVKANLDELEVDTRGEVQLEAKAKKVEVKFSPETTTKEQSDSTHRQASFSADHGTVTVQKGLGLVKQLGAEFKVEDPLALIPGLTEAAKSASTTDLDGISDTLTLEAFTPKASISRELSQDITKKWKGLKKKRKWVLTGFNHVTANMGMLKVDNQGALKGSAILHDFTFEAVPPSSTPGTLIAKAKSGSVSVNSPKGVLPEEIGDKPVNLSGQASVTLTKPELSGKFSSSAQSFKMKVPTVTATVDQAINFKLGDNGVFLPNGMTLEAHGEVAVTKEELGVTVTPQLRLHGSDKVFLTSGTKSKHLDLSSEVTLHKASHHVLMHTDQATGNNVVTPVMTEGGFTIKAPKLGPVQLDRLILQLDEKGNGSLSAKGLSFDLDSVSADDRVDYINRPIAPEIEQAGEDGGIRVQDTPLPKAVRWLLKKKNFHLDVEFGVQRGQLNLKGLRKVKPRFSTQRGAGIVDKAITFMLNRLVTAARKRLQQYSLEMRTTPQLKDGNMLMVETPYVNFAFGPVRKSIALPIPPAYIDPMTDTVPLSRVVHENSGIVLTTGANLKRATRILQNIKAEKPESIAELSQMCHDLSHDSSGVAALHMLAQQVPVEHIQTIFDKYPKRRTTLTKQLDSCGEEFIKHPQLQHPALQIFQVTKYKTSANIVAGLKESTEKEKKVDPTAMGMLMQQRKDTQEAARFYTLALERKMSMPLAHTQLGVILLDEQAAKGSIDGKRIDGKRIDEAMGHLLHGSLAGFAEAEEKITQAEKHTNSAISDRAKLHNATLALVREMTQDSEVNRLEQFNAAMSRLELLAQHTAIPQVRKAALKQLKNRQLNSKHVFHNQDERIFNKSRDEHAKYMATVRDKKKSPRKKAAYDLGKKFCYGSEGSPARLEHGIKLLEVAAADGYEQANIHLQALAAA